MSELFWQVVGDDLGTLLALTLAGAAIAYCQNLQARSDQDYVPLAPRALPRRARNRVGVTYRATRHVDPFYQAHLGATLPVGLSGDELSGDEEAEVAIWHRETQAKKRRGGPNYRGALRIFGGYDEEKNKEPKKRGKKEKNGLTLTEESKPACDGDTDAANNSTAASMINLVATLEEGDEREVEPGNESLERPLSRLGFHADESALAHTPGEIKNHVAGLDQDATCEYTDEEDLPDEDLVEQNQAHEMLIDHERGIYEPRWPQVSAYAEDAKIHISKAAKWFGFQDSCSPLDILRQTSRMEWLILRGIQDVTKEGIRKFEDDDVEPVKPSSQADIDRAVVLAHLRSLDLSQVLRDNEHELDVNEYQTLEDCIKALEGELSAAKPPKKYPIGRTRSTPREAITDRKRQGSRLKEEIKEEDETVSIQESRKESMTARKNSL